MGVFQFHIVQKVQGTQLKRIQKNGVDLLSMEI